VNFGAGNRIIRLAVAAMVVLGTLTFGVPDAGAAQINVVALGASNTYGKGRGRHPGGVNPGRAYPAQLQGLLRARGYDARVRNAGIPGDTTGGMLARLGSAVPAGTQVVILQPGGNDRRRGVSAGQRAANIATIRSRLQARGIKVIVLERILAMVPSSSRDPDGQHFDARGHAAVAAQLLPQVIAAVGGR
jgi:acyl-CoA thioesterase-1